MKMEVGNVAVAEVVVSKLNPRELNKAELKASDLYRSIKANGVQHPIEVRDVDGQKILLSGERRLMIAKDLKLKTIPAVIYTEMTDSEAYDKTHFENQAREELNPMEAAKDAQNLMELHKGDRKAVSSKLGLSDRELSLRLKLKDLIPGWQKALESLEEISDGHNLSELGIAHLELIARLSAEYQQEMLDNASDWLSSYEGLITVAELKTYIDDKYARILADVQWDLADAYVAADSPACNDCQNRSDRQDLLGLWATDEDPAGDKVHCLGVDCFVRKSWATLKTKILQLKDSHPELVIISDRELPAEIGKSESSYLYAACKKSEQGAKPCVTVAGTKVSGVKWVKSTRSAGAGDKLDKSEGPKSMAVRRKDLDGIRMKMVLESLVEELNEKSPVKKFYTVPYLASLVAVFGGSTCGQGHSEADDFVAVEKLQKGMTIDCSGDGQPVLVEILWGVVKYHIQTSITPVNGADALEKEALARKVAVLIEWPFDAALRNAVQEKPEPKSWANLNEDGTPKGK